MDVQSRGHLNFNNQERKSLCFENEHCVVFDVELNRKAPMHFLVLPKEIIKLSSASYGDEHLLGHLLLVAKNVAVKNGLQETGYRIIVDEDYGTSRLKCLHVFGGPYIGTERLMGTKSRI